MTYEDKEGRVVNCYMIYGDIESSVNTIELHCIISHVGILEIKKGAC